MAVKTYVLLDSMNVNAKIYQQLPNGKREQVLKIPRHRPSLQQLVYDKDGVSTVLRYKAHSRSVFQEEQIKDKIEANEKFTQTEYRDLVFKHGVLTTNKTIAQTYLELHPECDTSPYTCEEVHAPKYKLLDKAAESKIKNTEVKKRIKAANRVIELELEEAKEMLIRLNGSFFETPDELDDCQNLLLEFIDDAEEAGLDAVLAEDKDITIDEKTTILIGKLINEGLLSFDATEGKISKKDKDGKWIVIRDMSAEYSLNERKRLFSDFLNTEDGKPLKKDLEKDLKNVLIEDEDEIEDTPKKRMGRPKKDS